MNNPAANPTPSIPEAHASVLVPRGAGFFRKFFAFLGPGFLVAVGYMDPGNWATGIAGGARFGYTLLFVILLSNLIAMLMQHLCVKLGVVAGRDLAQACRDAYPLPVVVGLWILAELAIIACDLAEVIGSAIALQLLFGLPLVWGCLVTVGDVFLMLLLQNRGFRLIEALVITLIATIGVCFVLELVFAKPAWGKVLPGFLPSTSILHNQEMLFIAIGIIGATVMPHNLYLHSAIVQTRKFSPDEAGRRTAVRFGTLDSTLALGIALFINAAILVVAAAAFHGTAHQGVADIRDAQKLLTPVLGAAAASTLFAVALLASGQNSTLTGTLAGQIIMEGFLRFRLPPWLRRLITRALAVIPAVAVIAWFGEAKAADLLVASQVVLSMQLGFAIVPLLLFTGSRARMGVFKNPAWVQALGWASALLIIGLNVKFLVDGVRTLFGG